MDRINELAMETVRTAYFEYYVKKDARYILEQCTDSNIPLLGVVEPNWENEFRIINDHQHVQSINEETYMVSARICLNDVSGLMEDELIINGTFLCKYADDAILFVNVHLSRTEGTVVMDYSEKTESFYKKTLNYLYDVVFEYDSLNNSFSYDPVRYRDLFQVNSHFVSMDQWFWNMCTECVLQEDAELLDVFRSNDIGKRIRTGDCVVADDIRIRNREKGFIWVKMVVVFIPNEARNNLEKIFVMFKNIDRSKRLELDYISKSRKDLLTELYNRDFAEHEIEEFLNSGENTKGVYVIVDIDEFKTVNDTFGHITGDEILIKTARALYDNVANGDIVGRFGGDEFILFLKNCGDESTACARLDKILSCVRFEYSEYDKSIYIQCSAGATIASKDFRDLNKLYEKSDRNLYEAKNRGKNRFYIS